MPNPLPIADTIEKLIQLALKNPNREEAASAALKAVQLIDKFQVPIGADMNIIRDAPDWKPPSEDFMQTVADMFNNRQHKGTDDFKGTAGGGTSYEEKLMIQDSETMTKEDAARQRLIDAWRILREERRRLEGEVYREEQRKREKFWGFPCRQCGHDNGKPWA